LTIRAVARRAGVNERTVYRRLGNERGLRDAVMQRLEAQAGIDLATLELDDIGDVAARIVASISSHPLDPKPTLDPTLTATSQRQHEALLRALAPATPDWSDRERAIAAAMLDALWGVAVYERLAVDWELDRSDTTTAITWVIGLIREAIREGRRPGEPG
jgi:AcrR family transcriptional regulator